MVARTYQTHKLEEKLEKDSMSLKDLIQEAQEARTKKGWHDVLQMA